MKKFIILALLAASLVGCTSKNQYGPCVGINDGDRDPKLKYKVETVNVVVGIVFFEMIFPPVVVALDELYCPTGPKQ